MLEQTSTLEHGSTWASNENKRVLFIVGAEVAFKIMEVWKLRTPLVSKLFHWM